MNWLDGELLMSWGAFFILGAAFGAGADYARVWWKMNMPPWLGGGY